MARIAIIAEPDVARFFRVGGVKMSYGVDNPSQASELLRKLAEMKEVAIIGVTESIADKVKDVLDTLARRVYPTVIIIPGREGARGERVSMITDLIKRTVGVEVKL